MKLGGGLTLGSGFSNRNVIPPASNLASNHRGLCFDFLSKHLLPNTTVTANVARKEGTKTVVVTIV